VFARAADAAAESLRANTARSTAERERLEAIFDGMVEGVIVLGPGGRVQLANARARELFDAWGELSGRSALEATRRTEIADALARAAQSSGALAVEIALGESRVLEMHARRFPERGELQGVVAVFHDVSEIRRLESHRRDFVANVSHELRTPLASIQGFVETLHDDSLEPAQRKQYLDVVARNADRLRALIEDLLELSRIEGRTQPLALEPVDAAAIASSLLRDMRPRVEARGLSFSTSGAAPAALADARALEQVLQNLLDNALKYTEPGGQIAVRVAGTNGRVRIEVADSGIGIPDADRTRVFERFYRVDKARSRDLGGTGLGLAIVKHLVQAMDGEVFLESREGEGTSVAVVLPAAPSPP
jgi:two-component system phosphate regulon sensor histidine kinase PhoR